MRKDKGMTNWSSGILWYAVLVGGTNRNLATRKARGCFFNTRVLYLNNNIKNNTALPCVLKCIWLEDFGGGKVR